MGLLNLWTPHRLILMHLQPAGRSILEALRDSFAPRVEADVPVKVVVTYYQN